MLRRAVRRALRQWSERFARRYREGVPLSQLDARTALIIIDLQAGTVANPSAHPIADVVSNAARLAAEFRARGLPVVLVNYDPAGGPAGRTEYGALDIVVPDGWSTLVPELDSHSTDIHLTKNTWGAFSSTDLDARLRSLRVSQVVLAGVATTYGVESTARQAQEAGYSVALVTDAMTDPTIEGHEHAVARIFPVLGELTTTDAVLDLLAAG